MKNTHDGRAIARHNEQRVLKSLHKFGWLRSRDLAALIWAPAKSGTARDSYSPLPITVPSSALRMAQRTLRRLMDRCEVIAHRAPDGSTIYTLSEKGARLLRALGIPAKSGKDLARRFSLSHYHHRRLANEVAVSAVLDGYRIASEHEIAGGQWLGGMGGIDGKKPDVLVRSGKFAWWVEVERSRRNARDYDKLLSWLTGLWADQRDVWSPAVLPDGYALRQVVFLAERHFVERLQEDLLRRGWSSEATKLRIVAWQSLYVTEARLLTLETGAGAAGPA